MTCFIRRPPRQDEVRRDDVTLRSTILREEQPSRTTQTLVGILQRDESLHLERPVNVHTLATQLRRLDKTRRLPAQHATTFRRLEREHVNSLWQGDALFGPLRLRSDQAPAAGSRSTRQEAPRPNVLLHPHLTVVQVLSMRPIC